MKDYRTSIILCIALLITVILLGSLIESQDRTIQTQRQALKGCR